MAAPTGYTEIGFVGFTDKGTYNPTVNYVKNDLVNHKNIIWKCLKDNTTNIEPSSTATENWVSWLRGQVDTGTGPITTTEWSTTLSDNTWKQISDASRLGKASELWNVGDAVYTPIVSGEHESRIMVSRIAGFNHDDLAYEEGKAGITFITLFTVYPGRAMGVTQAAGGYLASNIVTELNAIEEKLTGDLRSVLKSVKKKVLQQSDDTVPEEFITKLFIPSASEMFSNTSLSNISPNFRLEGDTYELFNTANGTSSPDITGYTRGAYPVVRYAQATTTMANYWLRTPSTIATNYAAINSQGVSTYSANTTASYYKFMFCV